MPHSWTECNEGEKRKRVSEKIFLSILSLSEFINMYRLGRNATACCWLLFLSDYVKREEYITGEENE